MRASSIQRIRIITGGMLLVALLLIVRLYQLQIMHSADYRDAAKRQYVYTAQDLFSRGSIYMSTKNGEEVSAASLKTGYLVAINPSQIPTGSSTYEKINAIVPIDRADFYKKAEKKGDTYEEIVNKVSDDQGTQISSAKIAGVRA